MHLLDLLLGRGRRLGRHSRHNRHHGHNDDRGYDYQPPLQPTNSEGMTMGKMIYCPSCKANNQPMANFCAQCGTSLAPPVCKQCKNTLVLNSNFCPQCGQAN